MNKLNKFTAKWTLNIDNPNYPIYLYAAIHKVSAAIGIVNNAMATLINSDDTVVNLYKELIYNHFKLEWMKLKPHEAESVRFGTVPELWISVYTEKIGWKRVAFVCCELTEIIG